MFVSCSTDDNDKTEPTPSTQGTDGNGETPALPTDLLPESGFENLTEADFDNYTQDLAVRLLCMLYDPNADYNDIALIDHYMNGLAYAQATQGTTRGVWGQAKSVVDFALVVKDANALHRTTLVGAMAKWGYSDKQSREEIWQDIRKSGCLPSDCNSYTADQFWKEFSSGNLDTYARKVYDAVMSTAVDNNKTSDLATDMANNNLRHIDLTLAVAPKLVEAGANIVFAFGDDLISNGKLAYDFVNTNGTVMLQIAEGNLTADDFIDACNNNLKLLTKGLKEIVPTSQDLGELLADFTAEQIKALNKEIEDAIKRAGNQQLTSDDIAMFVDNVKDILLPTPWTINFADIVYQAKDGSTFEIEATKGGGEGKISYKLVYCDKYESVLLEAKCSVKKDYITIRVDYLDERCDLLPAGAAVDDIFPIPYLGGTGEAAPENIYLWWDSNLHEFKSFHIKREVLFTDLYFSSAFYCADENENSTRCIHKIAFTQDEMTITKKQNVYTVKALKEVDNISYSLEFQFDDEGTKRNGDPLVSNIRSLEFYRILLSGYQPTGKNSYWGDVYVTLSDVTYKGYTDASKYSTLQSNDKYLSWGGTNNDEAYTMKQFTAYMNYVQDGSTKTYNYAPQYGGLIDIKGFYQCDDINKY